MRFEVSRVMDSIERHLTTDVTLAQAVVDLGEVARCTELDSVRGTNLVRVGMAVDALCRYLVDEGAMLYPVVGRELLSEGELTSKERMVLGRWADDGRIEVTPGVVDRAVEVADFTGLPLIALRPYVEFAQRFRWLHDNPERLLRLGPRTGGAALSPADGVPVDPEIACAIAVGTAPVPDATHERARGTSKPAAPDYTEVFALRGALRLSHTRLVQRRFVRAEPSSVGASLIAREWRCGYDDCPAFGTVRRIGQPLPRMRQGVPACPRHGEPLVDVGPRPPSYAISIVADDLARRRFVVAPGRPVVVGSGDADEPDTISVREWLHEAAAAWVAQAHATLEVRDGTLVVTDTSDNGTVVWQRSGPDQRGKTQILHGTSYELGDWDSVELYTGIELVRGDRRLATTLGRSEPLSVLVDAPTAAHRQLSPS